MCQVVVELLTGVRRIYLAEAGEASEKRERRKSDGGGHHFFHFSISHLARIVFFFFFLVCLGALNSNTFCPSSASKEWKSITMAPPSPNQSNSKRETGSVGDVSSSSSSSSSPRPPQSPWAAEEETSATSLPSQPTPPPPALPRPQPQCNPKRLACEIQACFKRRGFEDPSRCAQEFEALKRCCETLAESSLHCSSDWQKKKEMN